jgi:hypothetical protein
MKIGDRILKNQSQIIRSFMPLIIYKECLPH